MPFDKHFNHEKSIAENPSSENDSKAELFVSPVKINTMPKRIKVAGVYNHNFASLESQSNLRKICGVNREIPTAARKRSP